VALQSYPVAAGPAQRQVGSHPIRMYLEDTQLLQVSYFYNQTKAKVSVVGYLENAADAGRVR
jgi:hypothetical protein